MTERSLHDLSHYTAQASEIGRLHVLSYHSVLPGDGAAFDVVGALRLSALQRGLSIDSKYDMFAFYVPHRQVYDNWETFITEGYDTAEVLDEQLLPLEISYIGHRLTVRAPLWLTEGYNQIYNNYFRPPTTVAARTGVPSDPLERLYGYRCANLKRIWNTGVANTVTAADYDVTAGATVSLLDIAKQKGYLKTELEREFFNIRYRDIVNSFGGYTQTSADERPTIIKKAHVWASGYDVDGTDQTSLGRFSGRVAQGFRFKVPRFFVPEHGTIFIMGLLRFPPISQHEIDYLVSNTQPSYAQISGDPAIWETQPPITMTAKDLFHGGSGNAIGYMPYGQWYRTKANMIHRTYINNRGFPFLDNIPGNVDQAVLVDSPDYVNMFQTTQLSHFNLQARVEAPIMRRLPSARDSILAGTMKG